MYYSALMINGPHLSKAKVVHLSKAKVVHLSSLLIYQPSICCIIKGMFKVKMALSLEMFIYPVIHLMECTGIKGMFQVSY